MEPVTPLCPVGHEPRKPCGAGLSVTQSGATTTPHGRLATTQGARATIPTTQSRTAWPHDRRTPLDISSSWAGQVQAVLPELGAPRAHPESASAQAERLLYVALLGAIEAGLVRTMEDAITVLRQASQPLGPVGEERLKRQERLLRGNRT
jgi:hypothetical protein